MRRRNPHGRFLARTCRAVAILLIPILLWTSGPVSAWTATSPNAAAAHGPSHPASAAAQTPTRVNRVVPTVAAPPLWPVFSLLPTIAEIRNARVFEEPLIPMGGRRSLLENRALAQALKAYAQAGDTENMSMFTAFLDRYPKSIWRASLLTNLGMVYRRAGYFSKALAALEEAWNRSRNEMGAEAYALADRAVGELADLLARLGHDQRLEALLAEINGRDIGGPATERISLARRALWTMRHSPEEAFHCGPYALSRIHAAMPSAFGPRPSALGPAPVVPNLKVRELDWQLPRSKSFDARASGQGMSLAELNALAGTAHMKFQMARRAPGARILLPALIHWKQNHYGALIKEDNGRYLLQDAALDHASGGELWIRPDVIDSEASEYFLVPEGALPKGWQPVSKQEGETVWGRGGTDYDDQDGTGCGDHKTGGTNCKSNCPSNSGGSGGSGGMARYSTHTMLVSLNIEDTPIGYTPPRGPAIDFTVTYNQREANQPANFNYCNLGPKWTFRWLSFIIDDPSAGAAAAPRRRPKHYMVLSGARTHTENQPQRQNGSVLVRTSASSYERRLPDGSKEIFNLPMGTTYPRKIFMTQIIDPVGNTVNLTYDVNFRLTAITDALGQVTRLDYELPGDPLKITKVTDPFGRVARFEYNAGDDGCLFRLGLEFVGELDRGMVSEALREQFRSRGQTLAPPIRVEVEQAGSRWRIIDATTTFYLRQEAGTLNVYTASRHRQLIKITDVIGLTSEFTYGCGDFINAMVTPYGRTTFAYGEAGRTRWLEATDPFGEKERVEFRPAAPGIQMVEQTLPSGMGLYNDFLHTRNSFYWDKKAYREAEAGRDDRRDYTKATLFHFLKSDDNVTGGTLESEKRPFENRVWYNYPGQPYFNHVGTGGEPSKIGRVLDDGTTQLYQFEYNNGFNKLTQAIDPLGRAIAYRYAPNQIDLLEVRQTRQNNELLAQFTYNTPTARCAPVGQNSEHLMCSATDASGQTTRFTYNQFGQPLTITNPRNETTTLSYNANSYLTRITGALPGSTTDFVYDGFGRVRTVTDSEGYPLTFDYDSMDRLTRVTYPDTTFSEIGYDRLDAVRLRDRLGRETRRSYNALQQLERVEDAMDPPRVTRLEWCRCGSLEKIIDPLNRETRWEYDLQGRVIKKTFPDGSKIRYTYERKTSRVASMVGPKNMEQYEYFLDNNLRQINYADVNATTAPVSFTYDSNYNRVLTMQDGTGTTTYTYNPITQTPMRGARQLASVTGPLPNSTITYTYDELGRVVGRAVNGVATTATYDALSRVTRVTNPLGAFDYSYVRATGRLDTIRYPNGQRTEYRYYDNLGDQRLQEIKHLKSDASILSQFDYTYDVKGQITTWAKQIEAQAPTVYAFQYDPAGQLLSAAPQTMNNGTVAPSQYVYQYDSASNRTSEQIDDTVTPSNYNNLNQLVNQQAAALPDPDPVVRRSEAEYDGLGRRVRIVEKQDDAVVSDKRFLWCGLELCEERDATGARVTKRFYAQGVQDNGNTYFYTRDHLGSLREMTDATGAIRARYDYDPYGRFTKVSGDLDADFAFTGHYVHAPTGLYFTRFRAYDPNLARWATRDPMGEVAGGLNLYSYVANNPTSRIDPQGLFFLELVTAAVAVVGAVVAGVVGVASGGTFAASATAFGTAITGALAGSGGSVGSAPGLVGSLVSAVTEPIVTAASSIAGLLDSFLGGLTGPALATASSAAGLGVSALEGGSDLAVAGVTTVFGEAGAILFAPGAGLGTLLTDDLPQGLITFKPPAPSGEPPSPGGSSLSGALGSRDLAPTRDLLPGTCPR